MAPYTRTFTYKDAEGKLEILDEEGKLTTEVYDQLGRPTQTLRRRGIADVLVRQLIYNSFGQFWEEQDAESKKTTFAYDAFKRPTRTTFADATYVTVTYDDVARTKTVTNANGFWTRYTYDARNRLVKVEQQVQKAPEVVYTTIYEYDLLDRLTRVIDPKNQVTRYEYGIFDKPTTVYPPTAQ